MKFQLLLAACAVAAMTQASMRDQFANPPSESRLQAWYHWTTTAISDKCIAADLKAMGELGIGTAHVFMPGQHGLPPHTEPLTPEWWKRWEATVREAKKNGIRLGFHNCPGWSSSGGKWIKPEDSMKMLVASATDADDFSRPIKLAQPLAIRDFYRDVAVYAFPIERPFVPTKVTGDFEADFEAFRTGAKHLLLPTDKKDAGHCEVVFEYAEPISPTSLITTWNESQFHLDVKVFSSVDGKAWKNIASHPYRLYNTQLTPKILPLGKCEKSRFFKLTVTTVKPPVWVGFIRRRLAKVEFSSMPLVVDVDDKTGASVNQGYVHPSNPSTKGIAKTSVKNVTSCFKDGMVDLGALQLKGLHRILRIGYTTTGKCCAPAPGNLRGLECDKLSKKGLDAHWPHMPHKMINALGAKGVVDVSIVDSWEVGGQNWTEEFPAEFKRRRGYDLMAYLPAMIGYTIGSAGETAKFLYDVQRTVSDLLCENYFDYFAELCHREGVKSATESYGGPFDNMRAFRSADIPTGEFWLGSSPAGSPRVAASAGHLNGRAKVGAESFTTEAKEGRWQITPHEFRVNGDRGWLEGISQLVYHSYLQQPFFNVQPGFSLDRHGTQFNRNSTWWPEGKYWAKYVNRGQFILQSGSSKADVLVYSGDATPNSFSYATEAVNAGYNFDYCGPHDLYRLVVRDGGVAMPSLPAYEVLYLGQNSFMSCKALRKVKELLEGGARIAGKKPIDTPTLCDTAEEWKKLVDEIWSGKYANLKIADSALKALTAFGVRAPAESSGMLRAIRRVIEGRDFYFLVNTGRTAFDGAVSFKAIGRPEKWNAKNGTISPLPWYADEAGRVKARISLNADESIFVSFRDPEAGEKPKVEWDGPVIEYADVKIVAARYEARDNAKLGIDVTDKIASLAATGKPFLLGNAVLGVRDPASNHYKVLHVDWTADGVARHADFAEYSYVSFKLVRERKEKIWDTLVDLSSGWTITSFSGKNAPAAPLRLDALCSWSESTDEKLKYFAGRAVYERRVEAVKGVDSAVLDLGDVRELVNVYIDGRFVECLWESPYRVEIPVGRAFDLKLEVVNTWPNRMIGDAKARKAGAEEKRGPCGVPQWVFDDRPDSGSGIYTWSNFGWAWSADDELRPAGLIGPVKITRK